jgi:hypothetical protein
MKHSDNYHAKYEIWAKSPAVWPLPNIEALPRFGSRKFSSYEEMNAWKKEYLCEIARSGGVRWKK